MKKYRIAGISYYFASAAFFISAIINFVNGDANKMAVVWLCLGAAMLSLGSAMMSKSKKENDKDDHN